MPSRYDTDLESTPKVCVALLLLNLGIWALGLT
jgi:hypothetical protein